MTLRHHRLARDASMKKSPRGSVPAMNSSPRRNSTAESYETGRSDAQKWFDRSNRNPTAMQTRQSMEGECGDAAP